MKTLWSVFAALCLSACASIAPPPDPAPLLADARFAAPGSAVSDDVFALSPAMRRYVAEELLPRARQRGARGALLSVLQDPRQLKLSYRTDFTRTAAEAFEARAGNCLSLVILTAALAHELRLQVSYQSVYGEQTWSRAEGYAYLTGHVNLALTADRTPSRSAVANERPVVIDFLPPDQAAGHRGRFIDENTVVAMYLNNRAVEELAAGRIDNAYWWVRAAVLRQPRHLGAYNTLGVVYRRHGDLPQAERVLAYALEREPANPQLLSNLALVAADLGKVPEAQRLRQRLAAVEEAAPFAYFDRGIAAMQAGQYAEAREQFQREIDRAAYTHEFHFWLGLANAAVGDAGKARRHLKLAQEYSSTPAEHALYSAKLDWLNRVSRAH
jgi:Tfp pilus assembly protein PilF